ncbi:hypothetical protein K9M06_02865 [Candidatus Bipolaricaulota bacterium]|nr:hypothetical protein [Candidatus Bipolaricaulota bacterium]
MKIPDYFDKILWSYDSSRLDPDEDMNLIIISAINYGDLEHWRWIKNYYGKDTVKSVLEAVPVEQLRERVRPLASILFDVEEFNNAPRSLN